MLFIENKKIKYVIWDFNGTILNDLDLSISVINEMLSKRGLKELSKEVYQNVFGFPVKDYYEKIGFDFEKEDWQKVGMEFISAYQKGFDTCSLFEDLIPIFNNLKLKGIHYSILSAMEHDHLVSVCKKLEIFDYFDNIFGIDNHFASSKVDRGKELISKIPYNLDEIILIGDTIHDAEVAKEIGIDCILVSRGHQSENVLLNSEAFLVLPDLSNLQKN